MRLLGMRLIRSMLVDDASSFRGSKLAEKGSPNEIVYPSVLVGKCLLNVVQVFVVVIVALVIITTTTTIIVGRYLEASSLTHYWLDIDIDL